MIWKDTENHIIYTIARKANYYFKEHKYNEVVLYQER